jgi:hypothetical protein
MTAYLFAWIITGTYSRPDNTEWKNLGEYATVQHCENAGRQLGIKPELFRCVLTGKK